MRAGIALGSNVGDRLANLRQAFRALRSLHQSDCDRLLVSSIYETAPLDCAPGTPWYLNAVAEIETELVPTALLSHLKKVETALGRPSKRPRNAPRTIDLDILYVGDNLMETPELTIPHPRLAGRRFVLMPLAEIVPERILPGQSRSIQQLLQALESTDTVTKVPETWNEF
ncbi:MAG: 2-amino-4-hydroxy-6-hydroxymethyldihydropteridine diphosphokinase [Verrucomicrobia bacterium]|nr:2-amino-4-hydroxy-6-hydroxymethyldihydropteridine diphosphokinase [Verrucomicrobiota bacterium]